MSEGRNVPEPIRARLDKLLKERQSLSEQLRAVDTMIGMLRSIVADMNGEPLPVAGRMRPAAAVRWMLGQHPEGLVLGEIVDRLEGEVETTSPDRRRLLYNTIRNMRKRGELEEQPDSATGKPRIFLPRSE